MQEINLIQNEEVTLLLESAWPFLLYRRYSCSNVNTEEGSCVVSKPRIPSNPLNVATFHT
jgi:hypothetical protein